MMMMMIMIMFMLVFMMIITMMMIVVIVCQRHGSFILLRPPCDQLPVQEEHNAGADEDRSNFSSDDLFSQPVAFCSWVVIREEMKLV